MSKNSTSQQEVPLLSSPSSPSPSSPSLVPVIVSPGRSPTKGNLTSSPKIIQNSAVTLSDNICTWKMNLKEGIRLLKAILNAKVEIENIREKKGEEEVDIAAKEEQTFAKIHGYCDELLTLHGAMVKVVRNMELVTEKLKQISKLELHQNQQAFVDQPLFKTWRTNDFYEASATLLSMYTAELALKETIVQQVAHVTGHDLQMLLLSAWIHEPYIEPKAELLLECFIQETGHR